NHFPYTTLFRSKLKTRRESIGKQMENLQANVKEWEAKALDLSQRLAQFNRIKGKVDRLKTLYDRLTNNLKDIDVSQVTGSEDQVSIMEMATPPISVRPGLIKSLLIGFGIGALAGLAILILLDRIDARMASFSESCHYHGALRCPHIVDRLRSAPGGIARGIRNFVRDWFLRSPEAGSKLARSRRADRL